MPTIYAIIESVYLSWQSFSGGKRARFLFSPAVIFPALRDTEMFNRFKVLCALLSCRTAVSGGGDDIATFTGLSGDAILGVLDELISTKAVRTRKPAKGSGKDSTSDLLGWLTQEEYELTPKGLAEIEKELHAWGKSKSFRPSLGFTIEHRLQRARKKKRK